MALLKPQFEFLDYIAPAQAKRFDGVVRSPQHLESILSGVYDDLPTVMPEWRLINAVASPLTGAKGNREFLLNLSNTIVVDCPAVADELDRQMGSPLSKQAFLSLIDAI